MSVGLTEIITSLIAGKIATLDGDRRLVYEMCLYMGGLWSALQLLDDEDRDIMCMLTDGVNKGVLKQIHPNWALLAGTKKDLQGCVDFAIQFVQDSTLFVRLHDEVPNIKVFVAYKDEYVHACPACRVQYFSLVQALRCEQSHSRDTSANRTCKRGGSRKSYALDKGYLETLAAYVDDMQEGDRVHLVRTMERRTARLLVSLGIDDHDVRSLFDDPVHASIEFDQVYDLMQYHLRGTVLYQGCKSLITEELVDRLQDLPRWREEMDSLFYHELLVCIIETHKQHLYREFVYEDDLEHCRISEESRTMPRDKYLNLVERVIFSKNLEVDWALCV
jgi:hypothetical protein